MPDPIKLLPCPFCGSSDVDPEGWSSSGGNLRAPRTGPGCKNCSATADSVELWNRRGIPLEVVGYFDSRVVAMCVCDGRLIVATERGVYERIDGEFRPLTFVMAPDA